MPIASVNGQHLYYTDTGGDLPVVVFSHGLLMNSEMFVPQIQALQNRYRCIAWDERGHGRTGSAYSDFTYYDSADDLHALLLSLEIERATLVGMSQGGYLSLRCALTHPEMVAKLVLLSTQAAAEEEATCRAYQALIDAWVDQGMTSVSDVVAGIILDHRSPVTPKWVRTWESYPPENLKVIVRTLLGRDDITSRLHQISVPALVVWGEQDAAVHESAAAALAAELPNSELLRIPDTGHAVNLTHPELVNPHIERFLKTL